LRNSGRANFARQTLNDKDKGYLTTRGLDAILVHAAEFIEQRLAPRAPRNDGKQTPWRGHPVFVAQHATATCCRGCLAKWHSIEKGRVLTAEEVDYVVAVIRRWLETQPADPADSVQLKLPDLG